MRWICKFIGFYMFYRLFSIIICHFDKFLRFLFFNSYNIFYENLNNKNIDKKSTNYDYFCKILKFFYDKRRIERFESQSFGFEELSLTTIKKLKKSKNYKNKALLAIFGTIQKRQKRS